MADPPDESKELALLNKAELRIALTDTDTKLQNILKVYLTPVLLKLASPHTSVRTKVISICQHINMRVKSQPIQLPVEALLKQFKDSEAGGKYPIIRNFDLMYIQQGVNRIDPKDRVAILPVIISGISTIPQQHQTLIFSILLDILPHYVPPLRGTTEDTALLKYFSFDSSPGDLLFIHHWFTKLMLLNHQILQSSGEQTCRGLSPAEYSFLTLSEKETGGQLGRALGEKLKIAKLAALRFLNTGAWTDEQRYLPSLLASSHSINEDSQVVELAEEIFKRSAPGVLLEDHGMGQELVEKLYQYFFFGEEEEESVSRGIPPVRWSLRQRIITLLCKSKLAVSGSFGRKVPLVLEISLSGSIGDTVAEWQDPADRKKLKRETFLYINWFSRVSDNHIIERYGPGIVEKLRYFIVEENQKSHERAGVAATLSGGSKGSDDLSSPAFEAMGLICRRLFNTMVYEPELGILRFMFSMLRTQGSTTTAGVRRGVEEALSSLLVGFSSSRIDYQQKVEDELAELLIEEVEGEERENMGHVHGRKAGLTYVATRFANRGLRFGNVKAKWICLLASAVVSGGSRSEFVEEGLRGLNPYWYIMLNPRSQIPVDEGNMDVDSHKSEAKYTFPDFVELIEYVTSPHIRLVGPSSTRRLIHNIPIEIYATTVDYLYRIFLMGAINSSEFTSDPQAFTTKLDNSIATDIVLQEKVADLLSVYSHPLSPKRRALEVLFTLALDGMLLDIPNCAEVWVELCKLAPQQLVAHWASQHEKVASLTNMVVEETFSTAGGGGNLDLEKRNLLVKALGSVLTHPVCDGTKHLTKQFQEMSSKGGYSSYTAILGTGYVLGRLALRGRLTDTLGSHEISTSIDVILGSILSPSISEKIVLEAGLQALGDICIFGVLTKEHIAKYEGFYEKLKTLALKQNIEKAITALGYFSMLYGSDEEDQTVIDDIEATLYALHENTKLELSFASGEALSVFTAGWRSKTLIRGFLDIRGASPPEQVVKRRNDGRLLRRVVDKLLGEFAKSTKPRLRRSVCVWLLSMVEGCGELEEVRSRLMDAQAVFRGFLMDREGFVQETASQGLTLVYEKGDKLMKNELVRSLIASFTGDLKAQTLAGQVSADTQLFEPGTLQTGTSDHGSISTYKDIMSLAAEIGDPSLVYRFMSLARHNSIWASRASFGRYGLGTILSSSSSSVDGYLMENPKLYPKLYRYRFDPNPNVRKSMNDIWSAIVKDSQGVLNKYFDEILQDLLKTILDREWRVREASCAALGDILQGREISRYANYLEKLWGVAFKVMDDIKESVRVAALTLCRVLAGVMTRIVDVESGASQKDADMVLSNLIPFLLGAQGLEAQAKEVQLFALGTLTKLIKNAGKGLRGYIPDLVEKLLELLSSLEPQALNYLHLNAAKYNLTEEKIDAARLSGVRSSPMMDAIDRCLDLLDEPTMATLVPRLNYTIRKAVGMPSKVGCSRVLVTLVLSHSFITHPHVDELLKTVMSVILDRNDAVSTSWAVAAGYLCRLSNEDSILALVDLAKKFWFEHEEEKARILAGEIVHDISKHATDRFNSMSSSILPFVYMAKHDISSTAASTTFSNVWHENTGGTGAIKLHIQEIVALAHGSLESNRWAIKQAAAITLANVCFSLGNSITVGNVDIIYPAIVSALGGKSWDGKEKVLEGYVELIGNLRGTLDEKREAEAKRIVLREAKRNNKAYQAQAMKSLGTFAGLMEEMNLFDEILEIVSTTLDEVGGTGWEDKMDLDGKADKSVRSSKHTIYLHSIEALAQAFRPELEYSEENLLKAFQYIEKPPKYLQVNYEIRLVQASAVDTLTSRLTFPPKGAILLRIWEFSLPLASDRGSEKLRTEIIKGGMSNVVKLVGALAENETDVRGSVKHDLEVLAKDERVLLLKSMLENASRGL